jgi:hypothetical protein
MTAHWPRRMPGTGAPRHGLIRLGTSMALGVPIAISLAFAAPRPADTVASVKPVAVLDKAGQARPVPVLAYYYIWYNASSWNRAKTDYPLVGRYSSDDVTVMRQQVAQAKSAGINGFLVSWKDTPVLDRRLANIRAVAAEAHFNLGIVFEGRDFHGNPLPTNEVKASFGYLIAHYGRDPVFHIFGGPLVAWSGSWAYTHSQLATITHAYGPRLTLLAMEKNVAGYEGVASLFRGDAYYWSSADPLHTPGYARKLSQFSAAIHQQGGLWLAPAAPGFDARLVGGSRVIPRRNGQTLRVAMDTAVRSSADVIGLISWNEYSENSEVEPSRAYGVAALKVIASFENAKPPAVADFDSSSPSGFHAGPNQLVIIGALVVLLAGSVAVIIYRRGRIT